MVVEGLVGTSLVAAVPASLLAHRAWRRRQAARILELRTPGAIREEGFVRIGGLDQWVSLRGEDRANPVVLELHGGPGAPNSIFAPRTRAWEHHFTLARWEMRGAGKTYAAAGETAQGPLSLARLFEDAIEVASNVRARTGASRLILLGHSFGSVLGLRLARARPDLFCAYVGTDQNVCTGDGLVHGFASTLATLRATGRAKEARVLEAMGPDARRWTAADWSASARLISMTDARLKKVLRNVVMASLWFSPAHTFEDLGMFAKGMTFSTSLQVEAARTCAREEGTRFELPVFLFQGEHDPLTPAAAAKAFLDEVEAPSKDLAIIPEATHFAAYARPDVFLDLLLTRVRPALHR